MPASLSIEEAGRLIEDLCLMDDVFFSRCFEGSNACAELMLRVILGRDDLEVTETRTQEWIQGLPGHSAKLDITARDSRGSIYDIEIQKAGKGAGRRRARFYSAMLDAGWLGKGEDCSSPRRATSSSSRLMMRSGEAWRFTMQNDAYGRPGSYMMMARI